MGVDSPVDAGLEFGDRCRGEQEGDVELEVDADIHIADTEVDDAHALDMALQVGVG